MGSFQVKKMRIKYLPQVYDLHNESFPNPAKARYYETLRGEKDSPFYIALNDDDEVVGYIATRIIRPKGYVIAGSYDITMPSLIVAAFTTKKDDENDYQEKKIKDALLDALMVQLRIGGFEDITADIRESQELSKTVFSDFGFSMIDGGKYKDGETKLRFTYSFDIELVSNEFRIERVSYKHLNRVKMLHNTYLLAEKDYGYFARIMKKKGSVMLVVVDEYGRVVGYLAARKQHKISDDKESPYKYLNFVSMAIDERARGNKLGQFLVESLIKEAKESDVEVIFGHVRENNSYARALYSKLGFKEKVIGEYKDTDEKKYKITKRIRYPSLKPYIAPTMKNGGLVAVGYLIRTLQNR